MRPAHIPHNGTLIEDIGTDEADRPRFHPKEFERSAYGGGGSDHIDSLTIGCGAVVKLHPPGDHETKEYIWIEDTGTPGFETIHRGQGGTKRRGWPTGTVAEIIGIADRQYKEPV